MKWDRSKRFTNGALIGISPNKFEKIIFATVCSRDPEALRRHGEDNLFGVREIELIILLSSPNDKFRDGLC